MKRTNKRQGKRKLFDQSFNHMSSIDFEKNLKIHIRLKPVFAIHLPKNYIKNITKRVKIDSKSV